MSRIARYLIVTGKVQGVFFRDWTVTRATGLVLDGWVRNRNDGTVEILAAGPAEAVDRLIALAHEGPTRARVERIDIVEIDDPGPTGFARR